MTRTVSEWIGKSSDAKIPPRVQLRIWEQCKGRCYICGRKLAPGDKYELDHIIALVNGGSNRESNISLACSWCHKPKSKADVAEKSKVAKKQAKYLGVTRPKQTIQSPGFPKRDPKPRKPTLPYRSLYE